jgi:hypothetical protein
MMDACRLLLVPMVAIAFHAFVCAGDADEWKIKRQEAYGFVQPPAVTRDGDRVAIAFETEGFCDVTVAVESANGRIIRHLASGVLAGQQRAGALRERLEEADAHMGRQGRHGPLHRR